jgi:PIN domain nuclease of toxin-antitoxin system
MRNAEVADPVLLDTCAAIWLMSRAPLSAPSRTAIRAAQSANLGVYLSAFSAWEIGTLVSKGCLHLTLAPGVRLAELTPKLLISSTALPGTPPSDPADRIIAATARMYGYRVITRDTKLLTYAAQKHILATAC